MTVPTEKLLRLAGGVLFAIGIGVTFSAIGRRTADPLAAMFFDSFTIVHILGVLVFGFGLMGIGLGIAKQAERFEEGKEDSE